MRLKRLGLGGLRSLLALLMLYAPLLCLRYCELRELSDGQTAMSESGYMALHHLVGRHAVGHHDGSGRHRPLDGLREMLAAVTEYIMPASALALVLTTATAVRPRGIQPNTPSRRVPTPPPRAAIA